MAESYRTRVMVGTYHMRLLNMLLAGEIDREKYHRLVNAAGERLKKGARASAVKETDQILLEMENDG